MTESKETVSVLVQQLDLLIVTSHILRLFLGPLPWLYESHKLGSVLLLFGSFIGISCLVFSETLHCDRGLYGAQIVRK